MKERATTWWLRPLMVWVAMMAAVALCLVMPHVLSQADSFFPTLAVSMVLLGLLAFGLAGVGSLSALNRLAAGAAFLFLALLLTLSFVDVSTRLSGPATPESAKNQEF